MNIQGIKFWRIISNWSSAGNWLYVYHSLLEAHLDLEILGLRLLRVAGSFEIFSRTFRFSGDTVDYFHGCPQRGQNGFPPSEIGTKNQKVLENLRSASRFQLLDLILAITLYLPVWHSHCTKASFTVLVWCSDELAVHSRPLLRLQTHVATLAIALFYHFS